MYNTRIYYVFVLFCIIFSIAVGVIWAVYYVLYVLLFIMYLLCINIDMRCLKLPRTILKTTAGGPGHTPAKPDRGNHNVAGDGP